MLAVKIAAGVLALAGVGAVFQTMTAARPGKKLALASVRYALEARARADRDAIVREAIAARSRLKSETDLDTVFRDVSTVWLAVEPNGELTRPTKMELEEIPITEAREAVRRLTPDTGFEGARIRSLFEARRQAPREQQPILARLLAANPADAAAARAYNAALRRGEPEERRKAIELARGYVAKEQRSRLSRLTLLLALHAEATRADRAKGGDPRLLAEARALAAELGREVPETSSSVESIRALGRDLARR